MANEKELSIDLKQDVAKGSYSNLAIITHSHSEFIIDFATMLPGLPKPEVSNRIIMTPEHAKRLFLALQDNINKYESQNIPYGRIWLRSKIIDYGRKIQENQGICLRR